MEIGISATDSDRLVPYNGVRAENRIPVKFDEHRFALRVDEAKRVHAEALHHPVAARNRAIRHHPHQHVSDFGHQAGEVPEGVVRARCLRHLKMRLRFDRVHQVWKLHRVLYEKHRHVVADQVPVALIGIELDGKAAHVTRQIRRAALTDDGREANKDRCALSRFGERGGHGQIGQRFVGTRKIRAHPSRARGRPAPECARDRSA